MKLIDLDAELDKNRTVIVAEEAFQDAFEVSWQFLVVCITSLVVKIWSNGIICH